MNYKDIKECGCCGSTNLYTYLDLGDQPLANSYHKNDQELPTYPLQMQVCKECWHNMLTVSVNPTAMFEDYLYVSDTSKTLNDYFDSLVERIQRRAKPRSVLEIACNSGLLLEKFQKLGCQCLGVDPAKNLRRYSATRNLNVLTEYWNLDCAARLMSSFNAVLAIHVLPHVPNPKEFLTACRRVITPTGSIYVQTSQCDMFINNEFDSCYHEHNHYFTAHSFFRLVNSVGLTVTGAWKVPIHSKSFLFELKDNGESTCNEFNDMIVSEKFTIDFFINFAKKTEKLKKRLVELVNGFIGGGKKVVGYGAAAKGNTVLNYTKIKLDYIVDDNELKWGYCTPGMNIPICSPNALYQEKEPVVIVPLAWNFFEEIYRNIKKNTSVRHYFIKYFPELSITL